MIIKSELAIEKIYKSFKPLLEKFYAKRVDNSYVMLDKDYDGLSEPLSEYFSAFYIDTPWFEYIPQIVSEILYRPVYIKAILDKVWTKQEAKAFAITNFIISNEQVSFNNEIKR